MNISEQLTNAIEEKQPVNNVRLLLENGADVNHQRPFKYSNLGLALQYEPKNEELIKLLLEHKANIINAYDKFIYKNIDIKYKKMIVKYAVLNNLDLYYLASTEVDNYLQTCIVELNLLKQMLHSKLPAFADVNENKTVKINLSSFPIYGDIIYVRINELMLKIYKRELNKM